MVAEPMCEYACTRAVHAVAALVALPSTKHQKYFRDDYKAALERLTCFTSALNEQVASHRPHDMLPCSQEYNLPADTAQPASSSLTACR